MRHVSGRVLVRPYDIVVETMLSRRHGIVGIGEKSQSTNLSLFLASQVGSYMFGIRDFRETTHIVT